MRLLAGLLLLLMILAFTPLSCRQEGMRVGSKKFTESVILGELVRLLAQDAGVPATHYRELGGTQLVFEALRQGDIDVYPDYTGTIAQEILRLGPDSSLVELEGALKPLGIGISPPLGFNNTYALGMLQGRARELGIEKISDLARHPDLKFGFSNEFMDRQDGWPNLRLRYGLPQRQVTGLDHDLAYRQLRLGAIDVVDAYTTDAKIATYELVLLEDDRRYFPRYDAVLLFRLDLPERFPTVMPSLARLAGAVSEPRMVAANAQVEVDRLPEERAAGEFLQTHLGVTVQVRESAAPARIRDRTIEHLELVRMSLVPAILLAIPLGVVAAKFPRLGQLILGAVGIVQTIPSLALLVILMPLMAYLGLASVGLGSATAITALWLYSLLPIVRNTHAGLQGIAREYYESAAALGLSPAFRLLHVELPLAAQSILAGIKTSAVINVGFATLGALIGAGGYGQPIVSGIRLNDTGLILEGAIPAALLALLVQGAFEVSERFVIPGRKRRVKGEE